jgi:hypothetical protein
MARRSGVVRIARSIPENVARGMDGWPQERRARGLLRIPPPPTRRFMTRPFSFHFAITSSTAALIAVLFAQDIGRPDHDGGESGKTSVFEADAEPLQPEVPRGAIPALVSSPLGEGVTPCVIYDSDQKDARLIGIGYLISAPLFAALPEEEKKRWHSHAHEVESRPWIAPRKAGAGVDR